MKQLIRILVKYLTPDLVYIVLGYYPSTYDDIASLINACPRFVHQYAECLQNNRSEAIYDALYQRSTWDGGDQRFGSDLLYTCIQRNYFNVITYLKPYIECKCTSDHHRAECIFIEHFVLHCCRYRRLNCLQGVIQCLCISHRRRRIKDAIRYIICITPVSTQTKDTSLMRTLFDSLAI